MPLQNIFMRTIQIPTFDEFNRYQFVKYVQVKIKNKPDYRDVNKITHHLPGIPQGGCGREPLKDLLSNGWKEVRSFYDARQNTRRFKGFLVTVIK